MTAFARPGSVAAITIFRRHHPLESVTFRTFTIHIKQRRIDSQLIAWDTAQSFDVKRWSCLRVARDTCDIIGPKNEYIAAVRFNEVVSEFIDENLIAGIDRSLGDDFPLPILISGHYLKVLAQGV